MSTQDLVSNEGVNVGILENHISRHLEKKVKITSATVERAAPKGSNFASIPWRVTYKFHEVGNESVVITNNVVIKTRLMDEKKDDISRIHTAVVITNNVVIKTRLMDEKKDGHVIGEIIFKNEILAYEQIIPALNEFVKSPLRVPGYIYGDINAIILEDMRTRSFYQITKKLATDWNQIWSPMQEMAKLHAASIIMNEDEEGRFQMLTNAITSIPFTRTKVLGEKQKTALQNVLRMLGDAAIADGSRLTRIVGNMLHDQLWQRQREIVNARAPVQVISHGAIWINNYLYRNDMITLLDWQDIKFTSPAVDLGYFLYANLDTDFLKKNRRDLLQFYLMHLHQHIYDSRQDIWTTKKMEEVLSTLSFDWIDGELKRCLLHSYMMALWVTPVYSWSEAVYELMEDVGGIESMPLEERLKHMTPDQKDRMIKLTQLYISESQQ